MLGDRSRERIWRCAGEVEGWAETAQRASAPSLPALLRGSKTTTMCVGRALSRRRMEFAKPAVRDVAQCYTRRE